MLIRIEEISRSKIIEYNSAMEYYNHYTKTTPEDKQVHKKLFCGILLTFFTKVSKEILRGWTFQTPIGSFLMEKTYLNPNVRYISHAGTKKARKETGDETVVVFREEDYYFRMIWICAGTLSKLRHFKFLSTKGNNRAINDNFDYLKLNVV